MGIQLFQESPLLFRRLQEIRERYEALTRELGDPRILADPRRMGQLAREQASLESVVQCAQEWEILRRKYQEVVDLLKDRSLDPELRELALEEREVLKRQFTSVERRLRQLLQPRDPRDDKNLFLEIRAGTGGEEAALFVADLFRMYSRYAERKGWKMEIISSSPTEMGGYREIIGLIEGRDVFRHLCYESGVHRVQRIPVTEASGRIHTSTVTVAILPEAKEVEVEIHPKDLRIDTFCASGPGGQHVNRTASGVRITHIPTGLVVTCQDERSQHKNRERAMRVLRSRLLERMQEEERQRRDQDRREQVGTGERSERIRTYNFPQNRVTDHRIGLTLYKLDQILDGDLDVLIEALMAQDQAEALQHG